MAWITLTLEDVARKVTGPELTALRSAALGAEQPDPVPELITDAIAKIRGYVAACPNNKLGPADTIPGQLVDTALVLIRNSALNRLPVKSLNTEARQREYDNAIALLRDVSACRFALEEPTAPGPEVMPSPTPLISEPCLTRTSRHSDGL